MFRLLSWKNKKCSDCAVSSLSVSYVMAIQAYYDSLDVDACLACLCEYELGIYEKEQPWFYKKMLAIWNENYKYKCVFELTNPTDINIYFCLDLFR